MIGQTSGLLIQKGRQPPLPMNISTGHLSEMSCLFTYRDM